MMLSKLIASAAAVLLGCACAFAQTADLDGDGLPETLDLTLGFHPDAPVVGSVAVRSGADGLVLLSIDGVNPGDGFAFSADFIPDMDGDGLPDLAIAAPRASVSTDRVGRVYIHSSVDGRLLRVLYGRRGDRLGFWVGEGQDINHDGTPDIEVDGMALVGRGLPADRRFVFSGTTGEMLFDQTYPIPGVKEVLVEPIESWGDLDGTNALGAGDLVEMVTLIGEQAGPESGADLNQDEEVDQGDLSLLAQAIADGQPPVEESDYVLAEWEWTGLKNSMDAWTFLYPDDVITATTHPDEWRGEAGATQWWIRGHLRADGARLVSGWMRADTAVTVQMQGQRAVSTASGSGPGGGGTGGGITPCLACVEILDCPPLVRIGEEFTIEANWCGTCTEKYWTVHNGNYDDLLDDPYADTLVHTIDFTEQWLPGTITVTAHCYYDGGDPGAAGCWRTDSCTIVLDDCLLDLEGCPVELREGESGALTAIAEPGGGTYTWALLDFSHVIENFSPSGNTATFDVKDDLGCFSQVPTVTVLVDYEKDGCHKQRVCQFDVVVDCDDDGLEDRNEGPPGSGNCPYWGVWDSDGDCLSDGDEINLWGTNPCSRDSDGDGVEDGIEVKLIRLGATYWDPNVPNDALQQDTDHDYLRDLEEVGDPCTPEPITHPVDFDSDDDGIWDGCEVNELETDPNDPSDPSNNGDFDQDGLSDAQEGCGEACTDIFNPDSDGDGLLDGEESFYLTGTSPCDPDFDGDGVLDGDEFSLGTDPANPDSDADGMPDGWERDNGFDPLDGGDGTLDADSDGLMNWQEYRYGTDPQGADSDLDQVPDGQEVGQSSDPNDADCSEPDCGVMVTLNIGNPGGDAKWTLSVGEARLPMDDWGVTPEPLVYPFGPGKTYPITIRFNGDRNKSCPRTRDFSYAASVTPDAGYAAILVDENPSDPDGNYCDRQETLLGSKDGSADQCNPAAGKIAYLVFDPIDLDIDSDNSDGLLPPARTCGEDAIEDEMSAAGKVVMVNDGDSDADGIPDFADGYDLDLSSSDDDLTDGEQFAPIVFNIAHLDDPSNARVQFQYAGSDPSLVQVDIEPDSIAAPVYTPAPGALRLWLKPGDQARSSLPVPDGDYVASGTEYLLGDLGLDPETGGEVTLYAEAVTASTSQGDMRILVEVSGQDFGQDAVRLTAIGTRFVEVLPDGSLLPVLHPEVSEPTPTIELTGFSVTNIRASDDNSRILADLTFTGLVDDQASDLIPGPEGIIAWLDFRTNGTPVAPDGTPIYDGDPTQPLTIPLQYDKLATPNSVLEQYDYSGWFSTTLVGIEIGVGLNRLELLATNAYGFTGFAMGTFSIGFTEPPTHFGAIDLSYDFSIADPYSTNPNDVVPANYWVNGQFFETELSPALGGTDPGLWINLEQTMSTRVLDGAVFTPDEPDVWDLEVTTPDNRLIEDWILHLETDLDSREFTARRVFEDFERPGWEGFDLFLESIDDPSEFLRSDGGMFHPVLLEVVGPTQVKAMLESIQLGGTGSTEYLLTTDSNGSTFLADEESQAAGLPRPLLVLPHNALSGDPDNGDDDPRDGLGNFARGFGTGVLDTGVGIWDGVKFIGKRAWYQVKHYNPISVTIRLVHNGNYFTVEDQQTISVAWAAATEIADFAWLIVQDQQAFMDALMTGDVEELNRLGEKYALVLEYSAEIIQAIADELAGLDDYEKGRIVGRIIGEVAVTLATSGAAQAAKAGTIANAVQKVRQVSYVQRYPGIISKLDDLVAFINYLSRSHICFVAGTPVLTDHGLVPIEQLAPGDRVLARDELTGRHAYQPIVHTISTRPDALYHITLTLDGGKTERIITTGEHPFYVAESQSFVPARELAIGDALVRAESIGTTAHIVDVQVQRGPPSHDQERFGWDGVAYRTYNIEVADFHTYFVGRAGLWVHNQSVGRAGCERVAALYHRFQHRESRTPWQAFERMMEVSDPTDPQFARRAAILDPHLRFAARQMALDMYDSANGNPALVKTVAEMRVYRDSLNGRLASANIDVQHAVPEYVLNRLGLEAYLDDAPGMLLHWDDHRISNANRPNSFHTILNQYIPQNRRQFDALFGTTFDKPRAKLLLRQAYVEWIERNGLIDPDVDHADNIASVLDAWLDSLP